jgi:DNA invertase Pin-like site-specific DNA recombinase
MRQIFGAIAEYEKSMIVIKLRGARQRQKARTGHCEGRKPYGYYPGEKRVIERMRTLRNDSLGFDRLAAKLNEEGFRTRKGTPWLGFAINRILSRTGKVGH